MFTKEECKTCQVLREQLSFERERTKELTSVITKLLTPVQPPAIINEPINLEPARRTWKARRDILERADREALRASQSAVAAKPKDDSKVQTQADKEIEQLELELGIQ